MNEAEVNELAEQVHDGTPTALIGPICQVLDYLNTEGYLRKPEVEIAYSDIQTGDKIHLVNRHDHPVPMEEIYTASKDQDYNGWAMPDDNFTFYLMNRPEKPKPKVEELEPGTRFSASLLGGPVAEFVRGRGEEVFQLRKDVGIVEWVATNADFEVEKVHS